MVLMSKLLVALKALAQVSHIATSYKNIFEALDEILGIVVHVFSVDAGSILLVEDGHLKFVATRGEKKDEIKKYKLKVGEGIAGWCVKEKVGLIVSNVNFPIILPEGVSKLEFKADIAKEVDYKVYNIICQAIFTGKEVWGAIELINRIGKEDFVAEDLDLLRCFANILALLLKIEHHKKSEITF